MFSSVLVYCFTISISHKIRRKCTYVMRPEAYSCIDTSNASNRRRSSSVTNDNSSKTFSYGSVINEEGDERNLDITLAKDQLFVCGDNRPDSLDSRTFGPIEAHQIVGKLSLHLLPLSESQKF